MKKTGLVPLFYHKDVSVGLVVDTVSEVVDIPEADIEPSPSFSAGARDHFIKGMGKLDDDIKMLIDVNCLLYDDLDSIEQAAGQ